MDSNDGYWQRYWRGRLSRRRLLGTTALGAAGLMAAAVVGCGDDDAQPDTGGPGTGGTSSPGATAGTQPGAILDPSGNKDFTTAKPGNWPAPPEYSKQASNKLLAQFHFSKIRDQVQDLGTPKMGGVFVVQAYGFGMNTLHPNDPGVTSTGQWQSGYHNAGLVNPDWWVNPELNAATSRYAVSESWEIPDPTTFIFKIRRPAPTFHDIPPASGAALTIDDVRETYKLYTSNRFFKANFDMIKGIEETQPGFYRITTNTPAVHLMGALRKEAFGVLNAKHIAAGDEAMNRAAIGLGAFTQGKFTPNQVRVWKRNPNWWWPKDKFGNQQPYLNGVVSKIVSDPAAAVASFRTGDSDYYRPANFEEWDRLRKEMDVHSLLSIGPASNSAILAMSNRDPVLKDPRVRKAISMAVDQQFIVDTIFGGAASPRSWIPWYFRGRPWPETLEEKGPNYKFDVQAAKNLLSQAGVTTPLKLEMHYAGQIAPGGGASGATGTQYVEPIRQNLQKIGIEVELKAYDTAGMTRTYFGGEWRGLAAHTFGTSAVDADEWAQQLLTGSGTNPVGVSDSKFDEMFRKQRATVNDEERAKIFQDMEQYAIHEEMLPGAMMPRPFSMALWRKYVHNAIESSLYTINGGLQQHTAERWVDDRTPQRNIDSY